MAPDSEEILDMSPKDLQKVLGLPVCKGDSLEKDGNIFTAYTLAVDSHDKIHDAYLKMRLCNPKARHIICAYWLENEEAEVHHRKGYCDDGEHGAGAKLLDYMCEQNLAARAIFVTRRYSGVKIGVDRFKYIIKAANSCLLMYPRNSVLDVVQEVDENYE